MLVIGTGFSGICCGIKLLEKGITNFRILEKSGGIGGTWWDNTYPGAACDVPSHFYCYSFEPNPDWTRVYSPQPEIQRYVEYCADKYGVTPYITNHCKVVNMQLDEAGGFWRVTTEHGEEIRARHVINGGGGLHQPSWPDIKGHGSFTGPTMHTARWDHSVDYAGKHVAIIGSAASAIQVIPAIADATSKVTVFQRTANYIVPRNDRDYSDKEKKRFRKNPWVLRLLRRSIFLRLDLIIFRVTRKTSWIREYFMWRIRRAIRSGISDPELAEKLIPNFAMGCKRILVSDDIYEALSRDDVEVVTDSIDSIESRGIRTASGRLIEADILVYATGYDLEAHMKSLPATGIGGEFLQDSWKNGPEAYNGIAVAGFPNYYFVTGPNTGVGTTSVVFMIEQTVRYIMELIDRAGDDMLTVQRDAQNKYNRHIHAALDETVWASGCKSWYRREDGKIVTLYPYDARTFRRQLSEVNFGHFDAVTVGAQGET